MTREDKLTEAKILATMKMDSHPKTPTDVLDLAFDPTEEEIDQFYEAKGSKKQSYLSKGDYVKITSTDPRFDRLRHSEYRVASTTGDSFATIGDASGTYLHGIKISHISPSKNKLRLFFRKILFFIKNKIK